MKEWKDYFTYDFMIFSINNEIIESGFNSNIYYEQKVDFNIDNIDDFSFKKEETENNLTERDSNVKSENEKKFCLEEDKKENLAKKFEDCKINEREIKAKNENYYGLKFYKSVIDEDKSELLSKDSEGAIIKNSDNIVNDHIDRNEENSAKPNPYNENQENNVINKNNINNINEISNKSKNEIAAAQLKKDEEKIENKTDEIIEDRPLVYNKKQMNVKDNNCETNKKAEANNNNNNNFKKETNKITKEEFNSNILNEEFEKFILENQAVNNKISPLKPKDFAAAANNKNKDSETCNERETNNHLNTLENYQSCEITEDILKEVNFEEIDKINRFIFDETSKNLIDKLNNIEKESNVENESCKNNNNENFSDDNFGFTTEQNNFNQINNNLKKEKNDDENLIKKEEKFFANEKIKNQFNNKSNKTKANNDIFKIENEERDSPTSNYESLRMIQNDFNELRINLQNYNSNNKSNKRFNTELKEIDINNLFNLDSAGEAKNNNKIISEKNKATKAKQKAFEFSNNATENNNTDKNIKNTNSIIENNTNNNNDNNNNTNKIISNNNNNLNKEIIDFNININTNNNIINEKTKDETNNENEENNLLAEPKSTENQLASCDSAGLKAKKPYKDFYLKEFENSSEKIFEEDNKKDSKEIESEMFNSNEFNNLNSEELGDFEKYKRFSSKPLSFSSRSRDDEIKCLNDRLFSYKNQNKIILEENKKLLEIINIFKILQNLDNSNKPNAINNLDNLNNLNNFENLMPNLDSNVNSDSFQNKNLEKSKLKDESEKAANEAYISAKISINNINNANKIESIVNFENVENELVHFEQMNFQKNYKKGFKKYIDFSEANKFLNNTNSVDKVNSLLLLDNENSISKDSKSNVNKESKNFKLNSNKNLKLNILGLADFKNNEVNENKNDEIINANINKVDVNSRKEENMLVLNNFDRSLFENSNCKVAAAHDLKANKPGEGSENNANAANASANANSISNPVSARISNERDFSFKNSSDNNNKTENLISNVNNNNNNNMTNNKPSEEILNLKKNLTINNNNNNIFNNEDLNYLEKNSSIISKANESIVNENLNFSNISSNRNSEFAAYNAKKKTFIKIDENYKNNKSKGGYSNKNYLNTRNSNSNNVSLNSGKNVQLINSNKISYINTAVVAAKGKSANLNSVAGAINNPEKKKEILVNLNVERKSENSEIKSLNSSSKNNLNLLNADKLASYNSNAEFSLPLVSRAAAQRNYIANQAGAINNNNNYNNYNNNDNNINLPLKPSNYNYNYNNRNNINQNSSNNSNNFNHNAQYNRQKINAATNTFSNKNLNKENSTTNLNKNYSNNKNNEILRHNLTGSFSDGNLNQLFRFTNFNPQEKLENKNYSTIIEELEKYRDINKKIIENLENEKNLNDGKINFTSRKRNVEYLEKVLNSVNDNVNSKMEKQRSENNLIPFYLIDKRKLFENMVNYLSDKRLKN